MQRSNPLSDAFMRHVGASALVALAMTVAMIVAMTSSHAGASSDRIQRVDVVHTSLQVHLESGRVLQDRDLIGATLSLALPGSAGTQRVRIESIVTDPTDPEGEVTLYRMSAINPVTGLGDEMCDPDPQGERWVFPVQGHWDAHGKRISNQGFTLTCSSGAQGKCLRFGYKPWKVTKDGVSLEDYHQACIRMVTADYCGDHGTTKDGMRIDLYDALGIQIPAESTGHDDLQFEAAWNTTGAVCVAHTRVPENITLQQLAERCPRLRSQLGAPCTEQKARSGELGTVLLFNRSR